MQRQGADRADPRRCEAIAYEIREQCRLDPECKFTAMFCRRFCENVKGCVDNASAGNSVAS